MCKIYAIVNTSYFWVIYRFYTFKSNLNGKREKIKKKNISTKFMSENSDEDSSFMFNRHAVFQKIIYEQLSIIIQRGVKEYIFDRLAIP